MVVYLTHGAKKNVGDYLIHSRARKLWSQVVPEAELISIPRWQRREFDEDARLLVLCGGPGFTPRMVESVFPVAGDALARGISVSGFALGWQGLPPRNPGAFAMSADSVSVLRELSERSPISVRDDVTAELATKIGINSVVTGCAAWYSLAHLGKSPATQHPEPQTIVFTTPAQARNTRESIEVMRLLRKLFPRATRIASFHRGIGRDELTTAKESRSLRAQAIAARAFGFEVRDTAYDLGKIGFYEETDLHIGYRVHAHLDFVSRRMPSILISEDGRGWGQTVTLHGPDQVLWARSQGLIGRLEQSITNELTNNWPSLVRATETIEKTFPVMKRTIQEQARLR